jgi:hypothetical protein
MRGPIVYCLEGIDNDGHARDLCLPPDSADFDAQLEAVDRPDLLGGCTTIAGRGLKVAWSDADEPTTTPTKFVAVPYALWDNREPGEMIVWLAERPEEVERPGQAVAARGVVLEASHVYAGDTLLALNDEVLPKSSKDHDVPRTTWWDRRGSVEWVSQRTREPRKLSHAKAYWFDDTGRGQCRTPKSWRLLWRDGDEWKPVALRDGQQYGTTLDRFNEIEFEGVSTREIRLEVELQAEFSGGLLEWQLK